MSNNNNLSEKGKQRLQSFQKEFQALLEKYEATISVGFGDFSDLHGIYDQCMNVDFKFVIDENTCPLHKVKHVEFTLADDWHLDENNIYQNHSHNDCDNENENGYHHPQLV